MGAEAVGHRKARCRRHVREDGDCESMSRGYRGVSRVRASAPHILNGRDANVSHMMTQQHPPWESEEAALGLSVWAFA